MRLPVKRKDESKEGDERKEEGGVFLSFKKRGKNMPENPNFSREGTKLQEIDKFKHSIAMNSQTCPERIIR